MEETYCLGAIIEKQLRMKAENKIPQILKFFCCLKKIQK